MELSLAEINEKTKNTIQFYSWEQLINIVEESRKYFFKFLNFLKENDYRKEYGFRIIPFEKHNPLIWEAVHPIFFMEKHCTRYITKNEYPKHSIFTNDIYDSYIISLEDRFNISKVPFSKIEDYCNENHDIILDYINLKQTELTNSEYYMIMFVMLHNHMHFESFLFTNQLVYKENPFDKKYRLELFKEKTQEPNKLEFIDIELNRYNFGGFYQGFRNKSIYVKDKKFHFDNEKDCFFKRMKKFRISKTLITNYMYLQFMLEEGYKKDEYWSVQGKLWKTKSYTTKPLHWNFNYGEWTVNYFGETIKLKDIYNYPIIHISWYEAEAFCNWKGGRLPTESEWEFLATNNSISLYPWGNEEDKLKLCNINYKKQWITSVNDNPEDVNLANKNGVEQLIGNCWEWCSNVIYPYEGFSIDPLYREMSYPFFGFKKVCRGGAWCVPDMLITSTYRNAQMPDCRIQYIGFRVVFDL